MLVIKINDQHKILSVQFILIVGYLIGNVTGIDGFGAFNFAWRERCVFDRQKLDGIEELEYSKIPQRSSNLENFESRIYKIKNLNT